MARINKVIANDDFTLTIELNNRHRIIYNMRPRLQTMRFFCLSDFKLFQTFHVEKARTVVWNDLCQITLDEIMDLVDR